MADIEILPMTDRIVSAYNVLRTGLNEWVGLIDLRRMLGEGNAWTTREEVDATLKTMSRDGRIHLVPESNRKVLTAEDHNAAVRIGGEDNHLICLA